MKKLFFLLVASLACAPAFAQDFILNKNGDEVKARVLEITPTEIKFKRFDNLEGPVIILAKNDVMMIKYENGTKDVFTASAPPDAPVVAPMDLFVKGQQDAQQHFKGHGAMWGTYAGTVIFAPIGLVTGLIVGASAPRVDPWRVSDQAMMREEAFLRGYRKQASRRKWGKVGAGFGLGLVTNVIVFSLLTNNKK